MPFAILVSSLATLLMVLGPSAMVEGQLDPSVAKAVNGCHKAATTATGSYTAATYKSFKTCIDAVFTCVQLKQLDADCIPKATAKCSKEAVKRDTLAAKLRTAIEKKCMGSK